MEVKCSFSAKWLSVTFYIYFICQTGYVLGAVPTEPYTVSMFVYSLFVVIGNNKELAAARCIFLSIIIELSHWLVVGNVAKFWGKPKL